MPRKRRTHLPKAALALELREKVGMSESEISEQTGIPKATVHNILSGEHGWDKIANTPVVRQHRAQQNAALEQAARTLAAQSFIRASEALPEASYYQAVIGGATLIDKYRLLAGEPTDVVLHVTDRRSVESVEALAAALSQVLISRQEKAIDITPKPSKG